MSVIQQIIDAQAHLMANPVRACVNTESSFVKQYLQQQGFTEAATLYWNFVTSANATRYITDQTVHDQEKQLKLIDSEFSMPAHGTSGT